MEVYQQLLTSLELLDHSSLLRQQILSLFQLCKEYWQVHEQYQNLDNAQKILNPLYNNNNNSINVISLNDRFNLSFFIKLLKKTSAVQVKQSMEKRLQEIFSDSRADSRIREILNKAKPNSATNHLVKQLKLSYAEYENNMVNVSGTNCKSALKAYDLFKCNSSAPEIALEKCVNSVLSKEFGDCVEKCIKHGNEKDQLALYLLIAPCRRAMIDGELDRYTVQSEKRRRRSRKILPWLNTGCYCGIKEMKNKIATILKEDSACSSSCELIEEYLELFSEYGLEP